MIVNLQQQSYSIYLFSVTARLASSASISWKVSLSSLFKAFSIERARGLTSGATSEIFMISSNGITSWGVNMGEVNKLVCPPCAPCATVAAFVLVTTKTGELWKVVDEARKIADVKIAKAVSGRYDVILHVETKDLSWVIARILDIKGIEKTETLVSLDVRFGA